MNHASRITGATFFEIAVSIRYDEGLTLETSAFESLYGG